MTAGSDLRAVALEQAEALVDLGRFDQAHAVLQPLLTDDPDDPEALLLLADSLLGEGRAGEALHLAERSLAIAPGQEPAQCTAALCNACLDRHEEARRHAEAALALDATSWVAQVTRAQVDITGGLFRVDGSTLAAAERAVELAPSDPTSHVVLGQVHALKSRTDQAKAAFVEALRLDPENVDAHRSLAELYTNTLEMREAIRTYRRAAALRPGDPRVRNDLASVVRQFFTAFSVALLAAAGVGLLLRDTGLVRLIFTGVVTAILWRTARSFRRVLAEAGSAQARAIRRATTGFWIRTVGLALGLLTFWVAPIVLPPGRLPLYLTSMTFVVGSAVVSGLWRAVVALVRAARRR